MRESRASGHEGPTSRMEVRLTSEQYVDMTRRKHADR